MTLDELTKSVLWAANSNNTNDYCERGMIIEALRLLEKKEPDIKNAIIRLRQIIPGLENNSTLVEPPECMKIFEKYYADKMNKMEEE